MPVTISMSVSSYDGRGRVRKLNQLFLAEFSAKGYPQPPFSSEFFYWDLHVVKRILHGMENSSWYVLTPSLR